MERQHGWCIICIIRDTLRRHANEGSYGSQKHGGDGNILGFLNVRGLQHFIRLRKFVPINDQLSAELGVDLNVKNQSYFPQAALTYQASHPDTARAWGKLQLGKDGGCLGLPPLSAREMWVQHQMCEIRPCSEAHRQKMMCPGKYLQIQRKDGRKLAVLRATRNALFLRKTFTLTPPKVDMSFNLHTTAGVSYKGKSQLTYTRHAASSLSSPTVQKML